MRRPMQCVVLTMAVSWHDMTAATRFSMVSVSLNRPIQSHYSQTSVYQTSIYSEFPVMSNSCQRPAHNQCRHKQNNMSYPTDITLWKFQGHSRGFNWVVARCLKFYREAVPSYEPGWYMPTWVAYTSVMYEWLFSESGRVGEVLFPFGTLASFHSPKS